MNRCFLTLILFISTISISQAQNESIEPIVADFERAKAMTLEYIDAMPAEKFSFRPTDEIRTYSEQMLHLAQGTIGLCGNGTGLERIFPNENLEKTESYQSKEEVRRIVAASFDYALEGIKSMDPNSFDEVVESGPFKVTRIGWIHKALEHITHHRGQCAIYLRLSGITPPQFQLF